MSTTLLIASNGKCRAEKLKTFTLKIVGAKEKCVPMSFETLNEASTLYRNFIECLECLGYGGASQAGQALILDGNKVVAHVSYNGKVWEGKPSQWSRDSKPIFTPENLI